MRTATLSPAEYAATKVRIAEINERAAKKGWTGRFTVTGEPRTVNVTGEDGTPVEETVVDVTLDGEAPSYEGWSFLANLTLVPQADGSTSWIVGCAPGVSDEDVDRAQLTPGGCDHCSYKRSRKNTYLVREDATGRTLQVGSTCIKDFLGWEGKFVFVSEKDVDTDDLFFGGWGGQVTGWPVDYTLTVALAAVRARGWIPRGGTAGFMGTYLSTDKSKKARELRADMDREWTAAEADVAPMVEALTVEFADASSGYGANLMAALGAEIATGKMFGLLASAYAAWQKALGREAEKKAAAQAAQAGEQVSVWLGSPGEKLTVEGTVTAALTVDGWAPNSTQMLVTVTTDGGSIVKTFTTAEWSWGVDPGDRVVLAATVKKHDEYRGQKQTIITRAKRLPQPAAA